jgi:hypothetical protein
LVRTPEKRAGIHGGLCAQVACYHTNNLDCVRAGSVARQQDIEIREERLLESFVDIVYLFGGGLGTLELTVAGVIA